MTAVKRQRLRSLGLLFLSTLINRPFHWTTLAVPSTGSIESNGLIARVLERFKMNPEEKLGFTSESQPEKKGWGEWFQCFFDGF